ncbi:MAG: chromate efflux transporter [Bacteroidota bacterium]|nr:chromate efflux transporter [Sediminibacterium sp.]
MYLLRHIPFLKAVFQHSLTAFGGPQVHLGLLQHRFVEQRRDLTAEELMEYNAFCQLLPGASSTQTVVLIAFKRGGFSLAFITLLIWILPATSFMASLAIAYTHFDLQPVLKTLHLLQPMVIGFIASATYLLYKKAIRNTITLFVFVLASILTVVGFNTPWTIPVVIVLAGIVTNFSNKRIPDEGAAPKKIKWVHLHLFLFFFLAAGFLSEQATRQNWEQRKVYNLFENNYRFGSFVFGGGDVLIPMMYEQYVTRPNSDRVKANKRDVLKINSAAFLTGSGIVRAIPGPIFSIASFTGALALEEKGIGGQILGAIVASIGVFLPSFLIVLFFFPIWQKLKKYALFYRSLEGIYAAVVGIMLGATLYLLKDILFDLGNLTTFNIGLYLLVFCSTAILLVRYKVAPQWVVLGTILLGAILTQWPIIF